MQVGKPILKSFTTSIHSIRSTTANDLMSSHISSSSRRPISISSSLINKFVIQSPPEIRNDFNHAFNLVRQYDPANTVHGKYK